MVDAQFINDRFVEDDQRDSAALADAQKLAAEIAASEPQPKSKADIFNERSAAIMAAARAIDHSGRVILEEFSKFTPKGEIISVGVKRLAPQELLAGDLLPVSARKLVSHFVEMGTKATKGERARVGLEDASDQEIINAVFDGDPVEAFKAYTEMINAICVACVRDPDLKLYLNEEAKGDDPYGIVVSVLPLADRDRIANWAMGQEEKAAQSVATFRREPLDAIHDVPQVGRRHGEAERPDQV